MPLSQNENSFVLTSVCRRSPPLARYERHALVPCVRKGSTKRGQRLGAVDVPATRLCRARQNQAWFRTILVGTAARNRRDAGCGFADIVVGATQWAIAYAAEGLTRQNYASARNLLGQNPSSPSSQDNYGKQPSEARRKLLPADSHS